MERYEPMAAVKPSTGLRLTYRSLHINAYLTLHWNLYPDTHHLGITDHSG